MADKYQVTDEIVNIQNNLLKNTIDKNTNIQLLQSESAVRELYATYAEKLKGLGTKIFKLQDSMVESRQVITKDYFDEVFQDVYNDLHALYIHVKYIDDLLKINLGSNTKFFNTMEKRIIELENKLDIARLNINTITSFDKVIFEGFSNKSVDNNYSNIDLDKKTGHITLSPIAIRNHNERYNIKNVTSSTYPVQNNDGGVIYTTNVLNTFEESYRRDGTNDMLINGLWKEQVYCNEIPDLQIRINPNDPSRYLQFNTQGIVSFVDIEFENIIDINNIDIDLYGEFETTVLGIFHKKQEDTPWEPMIRLEKKLINDQEIFVDTYKEETAFNIMKFRNLELQDAKFLRVVFNQKNYTIVDSSETEVNTSEQKINDDLSERRLEVVKLDGGSDSRPAKPKSYNYDSLHAELTDIVEYSANVEQMISEIIKVFEPKPKMKNIQFDKFLKYEVGAWSIEPTTKKYVGDGLFKSANYKYDEKSMVAASITTVQQDIRENTCNWTISNSVSDISVPIIPNDEIIRKEPVNVIDQYYYNTIGGWDNGTIFKLDFPIYVDSATGISIYEDGKPISINNTEFIFLNSTTLYIENIKDVRKHKYVIKYIPAKFDRVNIFTLFRYKNVATNDILPYSIAAPRESILRNFLAITGLEETYTIKRTQGTSLEYQSFFGNTNNLVLLKEQYESFSPSIKAKLNDYFVINLAESFRDREYDLWKNGIIDDTGEISNIAVLPSIPVTNERITV